MEFAFTEGLATARRRGARAAATFLWTGCFDAIASGLAERRWNSRVVPQREADIMFTRFAHDLRIAVRLAIRQPGISSIVILTFALGIGANAAVFSVVDGVLVKPLPYRDPGQLGFLWSRLEWLGVPRTWVSGGHLAILQRDTATIADFVAVRVNDTQLTDAGDPLQIRVGVSTTNVTDTLGVHPILGRTFQTADGLPGAPRVMILAYDLWHERFGGDRGAIGRRVTVGGKLTRSSECWDRTSGSFKPSGLNPRPRPVGAMILDRTAVLAIAGLIAGAVGAVGARRIIQTQLYEVSSTDPMTLAGAALLLLRVALVASVLPARRATSIDPVRALRAE